MALMAFCMLATSTMPVASMQLKARRDASLAAQPAVDDTSDDGAGTYRQELHNLGEVQYTGDIVVGGQPMRGILDTGSFELLVLSKDCKVCGDRNLLFDHEGSSSYSEGQTAAQHSFGSGVTFSNEAFDTVSAGPLSSRHQRFWEVFDAMMPILEESSFQAIVGVGPPDSALKLANDQEGDMSAMEEEFRDLGVDVPARFLSQSPADDVREARGAPVAPGALRGSDPPALCTKFGVRSFSVCIGQSAGSPGYFIWNDKLPVGQASIFTSVPVAGDIHWAARMTDVRVGHGRFGDDGVVRLGCGDGCAAVVDSGTSLIAAPPEVISMVEDALSKLKQDCSNLGDMPDLVFNLGGHEFSLPPDAYVGQVVQKGVRDILHFRFRSRHYSCVPLFMEIDTDTQLGPMWILGLPFFRKYYTSFSYDPSSSPSRKHMAMALADDRCYPVSGDSLLGSPRKRMHPRTVDLSQLHVPRWAEDAMNRTHFAV